MTVNKKFAMESGTSYMDILEHLKVPASKVLVNPSPSTVTLYYMKRCPHCHSIAPEFVKAIEMLDGQGYDKIKF